jgi:N6-adenosine-specific RNA methylase IME4
MTHKTILTDPPWKFAAWSEKGKGRSAEQHYPCMEMDDIRKLPVSKLADKDSTLLMWTTFPMLEKSFEVIKDWGFTYKTVAFVWVKLNKTSGDFILKSDGWKGWDQLFVGLGYWTRSNAELCLLATRGSPKRKSAKVHSVIVSPIGQHSEKPAEQYERIEELLDGPYLELFARKPREGWSSWGNEVDCDVDLGKVKRIEKTLVAKDKLQDDHGEGKGSTGYHKLITEED